jgi:pimeloyl-ACP methyl ester carboxylesterase
MKGVVFLHAFPYSPRMWEAEMALLKTRLPVLAPHYLGLSLEEAARKVLSEMEEMGLERAVFVGLSMGGYLIFELFRKAPERFLGVVLSSTRAGPDSEEARRNRYALRERVLKEGVGFLPEVLLPGHLGRTTRETKPKVVEKGQGAHPRGLPRGGGGKPQGPGRKTRLTTPSFPGWRCPPWSWWARRTPSPPRRRPKRCGRPSPTGAC